MITPARRSRSPPCLHILVTGQRRRIRPAQRSHVCPTRKASSYWSTLAGRTWAWRPTTPWGPGCGVPRAESRSRTAREDWEEVIADSQGRPFGDPDITQNDHIDSLAEFGGYIYASTANGGSSTYGTQVWRSSSGDPGTWERANSIGFASDGFGDIQNTNFKDMQVFDGWLCGGTQNWDWVNHLLPTWKPGAEGVVHEQRDGVGDEERPRLRRRRQHRGLVRVCLRWRPLFRRPELRQWRRRCGNPFSHDKPQRNSSLDGGAARAGRSRRADILGELDGYLYASDRGPAGIIILRSLGGDAGTWLQVNTAGMDGNSANGGAVVDSGTVFEGGIYVGVTNVETGFEVWRSAGLEQAGAKVDWVQAGTSGLGDPSNLYTELVPFNDQLYAWTSNYASGQQVRRTDCATPGNGADPPRPPLLDAVHSANDIGLTWTHAAGNAVYEVWRSPQPYVAPGAAQAVEIAEVLAPQTAPAVVFQDAGAANAAATAYYTLRGSKRRRRCLCCLQYNRSVLVCPCDGELGVRKRWRCGGFLHGQAKA